MFYLENYGPYAPLIRDGSIIVENTSITAQNWQMHFNAILNILRDGIEKPEIRTSFITIRFPEIDVDLTIPDYYNNLQLWYLVVAQGEIIRPKHLVFEQGVTRRVIKNFIDTHYVDKVRKTLDIILINNTIDDCLHNFKFIDEFSFYLSNTINLEDFVDLMNTNSEFYNLIHADLSNVPLDEVKKVGSDLSHRSIEIIKESEHCLANFFIAGEGVNPKQYKEFGINIGPKPDGRGGVYPIAVNTNFIIGGVNDITSFAIESSTGRIAQIIVESNVGTSGSFARLLGLNNIDTILHHDPNYICDSKNYQIQTITGMDMLKRFENRYYRLNPNGMEYLLTLEDTHLIGQTIYLRSPMTCASHAKGQGICYRCYGDLAYTNRVVNIGKLAAELISAILTQMMLSAKHLLESSMKKIKWSEEFSYIFDIEYNMIKLKEDMDFSGYKLIIDPEKISTEFEEEDETMTMERDFNEYIDSIIIKDPNGNICDIHTSNNDNLYITLDLNNLINEYLDGNDKQKERSNLIYTDEDNNIIVDLKAVQENEILLFAMQLHNNDLSKTLEKVNDILNKSSVTEKMNRHQLLQELNNTLIEGGLGVNSVHGEVILSNQLRSTTDVLLSPEWEYNDEPCVVMTLKKALSKHPSISVSLSYQSISKQLFSPLTYRKSKPSYMDLFFIEQPQNYLNNKSEIRIADREKYNEKGLQQIISYVEKTEEDSEEI